MIIAARKAAELEATAADLNALPGGGSATAIVADLGSEEGARALAGATILLPNGMGTPTKMVTASNGNFYLETPITLPVRAKASLCPNTDKAMTAMVNQANCNAAGCHAAGNRIHLP